MNERKTIQGVCDITGASDHLTKIGESLKQYEVTRIGYEMSRAKRDILLAKGLISPEGVYGRL